MASLTLIEWIVLAVLALLVFVVVALYRKVQGRDAPKPEKPAQEKPTASGWWAAAKAWFMRNNELAHGIMGAALIAFHKPIIWTIDPKALPIDAGVLSAVAYAIGTFYLLKWLVFVTMLNFWPTTRKFFNEDFDTRWEKMQPFHQHIMAFGYFALALWALVSLAGAFLRS